MENGPYKNYRMQENVIVWNMRKPGRLDKVNLRVLSMAVAREAILHPPVSTNQVESQ